MLVFVVIYQQFENYVLQPKLTSKTVDIHPAVAFGSVIAGTALLGAVGALIAIPEIGEGRRRSSVYVERGHDVTDDRASRDPATRWRRPLSTRLRPPARRPQQGRPGPEDTEGTGDGGSSCRRAGPPGPAAPGPGVYLPQAAVLGPGAGLGAATAGDVVPHHRLDGVLGEPTPARTITSTTSSASRPMLTLATPSPSSPLPVSHPHPTTWFADPGSYARECRVVRLTPKSNIHSYGGSGGARDG
ncbi:hypothetical protein SVIOM342S_09577 [Streptomyces violaceorubidus]